MRIKFTQKWKEVNQKNRTIRDNAYEFIDSKRKRIDKYPEIFNTVGVTLSYGEIMRYRVPDSKNRLMNISRNYLQPPNLPKDYRTSWDYILHSLGYRYTTEIEDYMRFAKGYIAHLEDKLPKKSFKNIYKHNITENYNDLVLSEHEKQSMFPKHLEYIEELKKEVERLERLTAVLITEPPDKHSIYAPEVNEALDTIKIPPNLGGNYASLFKTFMEYHPTQLDKLATITSSGGSISIGGSTSNSSSTDENTAKPDAKGVTTYKHPDIVETDDLKFVRGNVKTLKRNGRTIKGITVSEVDYILVHIHHRSNGINPSTVKYSMLDPYAWKIPMGYMGDLDTRWTDFEFIKIPGPQTWGTTHITYLIDVKALTDIYGNYVDAIHLLFHGERRFNSLEKNDEIIKVGFNMIKQGDRPKKVTKDQKVYNTGFTHTGKQIADFKMDCEIIWMGRPQKMFDIFIDIKTKEVVIYNHIDEIKKGNA